MKKITSGDVCAICDKVEDFWGKKDPTITKESIADDIEEAYAYANEVGVSDKSEDDNDNREANRRLIFDDLTNCPWKTIAVLEVLAADFLDHERESELEL